MTKEITYGALIPLIGGFPIGASMALNNKPPKFVISYGAFGANDGLYKTYLEKQGHDVPWYIVDESDDFLQEEIDRYADILVSTCPCAGLSMLNSGAKAGSASTRGGDAAQNDWMYASTEYALKHVRPRVLIGENAPGLYTQMGQKVFDRLAKIADDNGYSFSAYKTSTIKHGLPQHRQRTFFFCWDSATAPVMDRIEKPFPKLQELLADVPKTASHYDQYPFNYHMRDKFCYRWAKLKHGDQFRQVIAGKGYKTIYQYAIDEGLLDELDEYVQKYEGDKAKRVMEHIRNKLSMGKGIWDSSSHIFLDEFNAVVGRNMCDAIHPTEDRLLNIREFMTLMGLPTDFDIPTAADANKICQNVPTVTGADMVRQAVRFIEGELPSSGQRVFKQSNISAQPGVKKRKTEFNDELLAFYQK